MPRHIVHIGQRKTGTTWLQEVLRCAAPELGFAFDHDALRAWGAANVDAAEGTADYAGLIEVLARFRDRDAFFSLEQMISHDPVRMAAAVFEAVPDARILVTTRGPDGYLQSSYTQSMKKGQKFRAGEFSRRYLKNHVGRTHNFAAVSDAYGAERVTFIPYELLHDDAAAFLREIGDLFGCDLVPYARSDGENVSPPPMILELVRSVNERMSKDAPDFLQTPQWRQLLNIAIQSSGRAKDAWPLFERELRLFKLTWETAALPAEMWPGISAMASPLRGLPLYRPYLAAYGLG